VILHLGEGEWDGTKDGERRKQRLADATICQELHEQSEEVDEPKVEEGDL